MSSRVFLLGVGGLSLDILDPLIHHGWLPNLEFLMGHGVVGPLTSDIPPFPAAEWSTLLSGEGPGTTGFLEGWRKESGTYFPEVASLSVLAQRTPGSLLGGTFETTLVGVPLPGASGPIPSEEEIQILHWKAGRFSVRCMDLSSRSLGECESDSGVEETQECFFERAIRRMIVLSVSISRTIRESGAKVVAVHFGGLDRILSRYQRDILSSLLGLNKGIPKSLLRQFFRVFDDALGSVLELSRKTDSIIILASGHGFVPVRRVLNLNAFLFSQGYLGLKPEVGGEIIFRGVAAPLLRAMNIKRGMVKKILGRPGLREVLDRTGSLLSSEIGLFNWERTRAFALSRTGITLNVKGVETQGIVNPGPEMRALGEEIRHNLLSLKDPVLGKFPVKDIQWREDLYDGVGLPDLPHLIIRGWEPDYILEDWRKISSLEDVFSNPNGRTSVPGGPGFYCLSRSSYFGRDHSPRSRTLTEIAALIAKPLNREDSTDKSSHFHSI